MERLDDTDKTALLLRYFENKSLREVGTALGASDNAVQKRIARALERLREFFQKRGVAVGASGLAAAVSANAVQAAPAGLAATISSAASVASSAAATTITKAIAMTILKKTCVTATIIIAVGTGIHLEMHKVLPLQRQVN